MEVDYLVVGQGLAGSLLSYNLLKENKSVLIVDSNEEITSSKIAAGIYNPITGRRLVKTWLADSLFPFLDTFYSDLESFLGTTFLHKKAMFRPFDSISDQNYWYGQSSDEAFKSYIRLVETDQEILKHYHAPYGGFYTELSGYVQVKLMLESFDTYFQQQGMILQENCSVENLTILEDKINFKNISAKAIIFCEGHNNKDNELFKYLPIEPTKGQILDVKIDNYQIESIVNKRVFILPESNYQRIGSTYERDFDDLLPTEEARNDLSAKLEAVLKSQYKIINQRTAVRPTTVDRRPILGKHPLYSNVFIFNGLGTKGVSLAPYFSLQMANFLIHHKPLMPEVDIRRFDYLYH
ncbi:MAG: FAD-binding oxidoreductase [Opitutaceae bacterium]|nr:FAD-binding oxidoreductase [Cytophagales bacterium]